MHCACLKSTAAQPLPALLYTPVLILPAPCPRRSLASASHPGSPGSRSLPLGSHLPSPQQEDAPKKTALHGTPVFLSSVPVPFSSHVFDVVSYFQQEGRWVPVVYYGEWTAKACGFFVRLLDMFSYTVKGIITIIIMLFFLLCFLGRERLEVLCVYCLCTECVIKGRFCKMPEFS